MKTIVYTLGRMNPPTKGHQKLISAVLEVARKIGGDHVVYLSQTQNGATDPLDWNFKRRVCESAFKGVNISKDLAIKNPFIALETLSKSYDKVVLVVGSDQVAEFTNRLTPYANKWGTEFEVVSAGNRIKESSGVEGMSATKMRKYALDNNVEKFYEGLPTGLSEGLKKLVFNNTRKGLKKTK